MPLYTLTLTWVIYLMKSRALWWLKWFEHPTPPQSWLRDRGIKPRVGLTKDFKNDTRCCIPWHSPRAKEVLGQHLVIGWRYGSGTRSCCTHTHPSTHKQTPTPAMPVHPPTRSWRYVTLNLSPCTKYWMCADVEWYLVMTRWPDGKGTVLPSKNKLGVRALQELTVHVVRQYMGIWFLL